MSFKFRWGDFTPEFVEEVRSSLTRSLASNSSGLPSNIVGEFKVTHLDFGAKAPLLEILEVVDIDEDIFKAIFNLTYDGDMNLIFQTLVQANPLAEQAPFLPSFHSIEILMANKPLVVPMFLKISNLVLKGIIVLSISKRNGVTLVFKNEPLESVKVSSSFDNVSSIQHKLQKTIEKVLQTLLVEDLPKIIHQISVRQIEKQAILVEQERMLKLHKEQLKIEKMSQLFLEKQLEREKLNNIYRKYEAPSSTDTSLWSAPETQFYNHNIPLTQSISYSQDQPHSRPPIYRHSSMLNDARSDYINSYRYNTHAQNHEIIYDSQISLPESIYLSNPHLPRSVSFTSSGYQAYPNSADTSDEREKRHNRSHGHNNSNSYNFGHESDDDNESHLGMVMNTPTKPHKSKQPFLHQDSAPSIAKAEPQALAPNQVSMAESQDGSVYGAATILSAFLKDDYNRLNHYGDLPFKQSLQNEENNKNPNLNPLPAQKPKSKLSKDRNKSSKKYKKKPNGSVANKRSSTGSGLLRSSSPQQQLQSYTIDPSENALAANLASLMKIGHTLSPYTRPFKHTTFRSDVNNEQYDTFHSRQTSAIYSSTPLSPPTSNNVSFTQLYRRNSHTEGATNAINNTSSSNNNIATHFIPEDSNLGRAGSHPNLAWNNTDQYYLNHQLNSASVIASSSNAPSTNQNQSQNPNATPRFRRPIKKTVIHVPAISFFANSTPS